MKSITLTRNHKEGDVQYYAGQIVVLPDETVEWLISSSLAERASNVKFAAVKQEEEQKLPA